MATAYEDTPQATAASFGWSAAVLNSNPELKSLFNQATAGNWTPDHFVAKIRDTKWFKTTADTARQALILQKADPATYALRVNAAAATARAQAGAAGATLTAAQLNTIATHSVMFGWNGDQLKQSLSSFIKPGAGGRYNGTAAAYQNQYAEMAGQYGVTVPASQMGRWISGSVTGTTTSDGVKQYMIQQASSRYPALADRIKAGETVQQIADPYMQSYAKVLETNPNAIKLSDNLIQKALTGKDAKGQPSTSTVWQFEQDLRSDPRFMKTQGAQDQSMALAHKVLQDMGVKS